jgi:hypothetical protein
LRRFIFTRTESLDLDALEPVIDEIRDSFDRYLDTYPVKTSKSKHGLMGPVGKILQEVKGGKWDAPSLTGYALNIHLSNPRVKGISDAARSALDEGIAKLIELLKSAPVKTHERILDRVDYGLYYLRRKKGLAWFETVRKEWAAFLKKKYGDGQSVSEAWNEKTDSIGKDFEKLAYPSKQAFNKARGQKRKDMEDFIQQAQLKGYTFEEEEE